MTAPKKSVSTHARADGSTQTANRIGGEFDTKAGSGNPGAAADPFETPEGRQAVATPTFERPVMPGFRERVRQAWQRNVIVPLPESDYHNIVYGSNSLRFVHAEGADGVVRRFAVDASESSPDGSIRFQVGSSLVDRRILPAFDRKEQEDFDRSRAGEFLSRRSEAQLTAKRAEGLSAAERQQFGLPDDAELNARSEELEAEWSRITATAPTLAQGSVYLSQDDVDYRRSLPLRHRLRDSAEFHDEAVRIRQELDAGGWIVDGKLDDGTPPELRARAFELDELGQKDRLWSARP